MLKRITLSCALLIAGSSIAQTEINPDEINSRNASAIHQERLERLEKRDQRRRERAVKRNEAKQEVVKYLAESFTLPNANFPKPRRLTTSEVKSIGLLKCVERIIEKKKAGYDGPDVAQKILLRVMEGDALTTNEDLIVQARNDCWKTYDALDSFKNKEIDKANFYGSVSALPGRSSAEKKTKSVVTNLVHKSFIDCKFTEVVAKAGVLIIGAVGGVTSVKCLLNNGQVISYIGPKIGYSGTVGASVEINRQSWDDLNIIGKKIAALVLSEEEENYHNEDQLAGYVIGFGNRDEYGNSKGLAVGMSMTVAEYSVGLGLRSFGEKRQWDKIIDLLK